MRRRFKLLMWAGGLIITVLVLILCWPRTPGLSAGASLPAGKVEPQLVSAWDTGVLLAPDGSLWVWGGTESGHVGLLGYSNRTPIPQRLGTNSDWQKIAASQSCLLALKSTGSLWSWGKWPGEEPGSNRNAATFPLRVGVETDWETIAVGVTHGMALKQDGSLWTWGRNHYGQLGIESTNSKSAPVRIGNDRWNAIAAGSFNSFALRRDGTLWRWGLDPLHGKPQTNDFFPRLMDPGTNWIAVSASSYCVLALKADGSLWLCGQNARWTAPTYVTKATAAFIQIGTDVDWKQIHCGEQYFFARKSDGSWWSCGQNRDGRMGLGSGVKSESIELPQRLPFTFEPWAIALGSDRGATLILLKDGTLWSCGVCLGEKLPSTRFDYWKRKANGLARHFPGKPVPFPIRQFRIDTVPRPFWRLPPDVVKASPEPPRS